MLLSAILGLTGAVLAMGVAVIVPAPMTRPPRGWTSRGVFDCKLDCSAGMDTCLRLVELKHAVLKPH